MKKIAAFAALSASALAMSVSASFADYTLNILHINDWHSRIESNNKFESTCSAEDEGKGECIGGAARLVTAIAQERQKLQGQNVVLLNAGDNFQGSLFYTTYKGKAEAEFLNLMKFDAMTLGNHEFDDGEDALAPFLDIIKFPVTTANVKPNAQSKLGDRIKPSLVLEIGGQKIGIVGGLTNDVVDISSPGPNVAIEDDVKAMTAEVEKLKAQGVNKIIALTHIGYVRERDVIAKIPGVDVVVGGHSHSLLSKTDPKAEGPVSDDGRQPGRLQGAGGAGGVLFEVSRRDQDRVRRQWRRQGSDRRPDLPRQVDNAGRSRACPHQGTRRADRGAEDPGSLRDDRCRSTAAATIAAPANARWATWSRTRSSIASRARACRSCSRTAAACALRSTRAWSRWARC